MFEQHPAFCRICGRTPCDCHYCHGARFVRFKGRDIPCDACNPAPDELDAPTPISTRGAWWGR